MKDIAFQAFIAIGVGFGTWEILRGFRTGSISTIDNLMLSANRASRPTLFWLIVIMNATFCIGGTMLIVFGF